MDHLCKRAFFVIGFLIGIGYGVCACVMVTGDQNTIKISTPVMATVPLGVTP